MDDVGESALVHAVKVQKDAGRTVVLITHRPGILGVADRLIVLRDGVVQANGPRDQVIAALRTAQESVSRASLDTASGVSPAIPNPA